MRIWLRMMILCLALFLPAEALEITAPAVPPEGRLLMPENTDSFPEAFPELVKKALAALCPDLREAAETAGSAFSVALLLNLVSVFTAEKVMAVRLAGAATVSGVLLGGTNSLLNLAADTVQQLSDYGKLLLPVMTAGLAAQGGVTASTGLYIGTAFFDSLLGSLLTGVFVPGVYLYLALAVALSATGEDILKRLRDLLRGSISWSLKTVLTVFTTYMSITGAVSGTTDAAALKATKVTISTVVPVVGGILSDASEAVLVGAGVMKNAAGVYGILAVLTLVLGPFLQIGAHYLMLKLTAALCSVFGGGGISDLVDDFASAMGMLLAITGSMCLLILISTVCFLKGVG